VAAHAVPVTSSVATSESGGGKLTFGRFESAWSSDASGGGRLEKKASIFCCLDVSLLFCFAMPSRGGMVVVGGRGLLRSEA
jgi:hypothetical protein